jgi:hypothetical protein
MHVGFVADKVALRQVSLFSSKFLGFILSISSQQGSMLNHLGMKNRPVGGRSSETQPHPIDMNKMSCERIRICLSILSTDASLPSFPRGDIL